MIHKLIDFELVQKMAGSYCVLIYVFSCIGTFLDSAIDFCTVTKPL